MFATVGKNQTERTRLPAVARISNIACTPKLAILNINWTDTFNVTRVPCKSIANVRLSSAYPSWSRVSNTSLSIINSGNYEVPMPKKYKPSRSIIHTLYFMCPTRQDPLYNSVYNRKFLHSEFYAILQSPLHNKTGQHQWFTCCLSWTIVEMFLVPTIFLSKHFDFFVRPQWPRADRFYRSMRKGRA